MNKPILIVDDEPDALELIKFNLEGSGFDVTTATDGEEGLQKARAVLPALIILDVMMPGMNGTEVCKVLKREANTAAIPIIMLTAKAAEIDRVLGLELGAADYVTKPFSPRELVLRVKNLLRRETEPKAAPPERIHIGELLIDVPCHEVRVHGQRVRLTTTEFRLLTVLAQRQGRVQTREQLLRDVWEYDTVIDTRTVDTHMRRLRQKLGRAAHLLESVRGVGYRFAD